MLHLFAENVQCKHLIFGCCHHGGYAVALEKYACNPIKSSSITLLKSYEVNEVFEGLPFDTVEFPRTFRSTPYRETDRLAEDPKYPQELPQPPGAELDMTEAEKSRAKEIEEKNEAITKWRANAGVPMTVQRTAPSPSPARTPWGWRSEKSVLLNINDERVDPELGEVDYETSQSMQDRTETLRFCVSYHLQQSCLTKAAGGICNLRHGPQLNDDELRWLWKDSRRRGCNQGSQCRRVNCFYGHMCPNQPGCPRGTKCSLNMFHGVDRTVVRILSSEKALSPRKKG